MKRYEFHLSILPEEFLAYYRGRIKQVLVGCSHGLTVQFPASLLQPFITASGIHGHFVLTCNDNHSGADLQRLP